MIRSLARLGAVALAATSTIALGQTPPATPAPAPARALDMALGIEAAQAAIEACKKDGFNVGVVIVDAAGVLKVFLAADGAGKNAVESSQKKAAAVIAFKASNTETMEKAKTDPALDAKIKADTSLMVRPGGMLLMAGNDMIGAIGLGGVPGTGGGAVKDEACANVGLDKIKGRIK
jgi:uncharacterized protein GlcG (DUF336 family)